MQPFVIRLGRSCVFVMIVSPFPLFERFCCPKKEATSLHSGLIANGRARRQSRRGGAVYWSGTKTLDGTSARPGAASCGEGDLWENCFNRGIESALTFSRFCVGFDLL